jgi:hypothetical protein
MGDRPRALGGRLIAASACLSVCLRNDTYDIWRKPSSSVCASYDADPIDLRVAPVDRVQPADRVGVAIIQYRRAPMS